MAWLEICRPINGVIAFISVLLGAYFSSGDFFGSKPIITAIAAFLVLSAGNAINDFCDLEIDLINKPNRPIPSGRIKRNHALIFSIMLLMIGSTLGFWVNFWALMIVISVSLTLIAYAFWLKRTPLIGNIVVGILTGLTFLAGGVSVARIVPTIMPSIFAFLFTTAREIVKDIEDLDGDLLENAKTVPIVYGVEIAVNLAIGFMIAIIFVSPIPFLTKWYSWHYLIVMIFGVDLPLIFLIIKLRRSASRESCAKIQKLMKIDIFIGLLAIFLG